MQSCDVSVIVGVDAELVSSVGDVEDRIVSESRAFLPADVKEQLQDTVNEIVRPFGLETRLVLLERVNSIALMFLCMTLSAVMSLRDQWRTGQLRDIVEKLFTFLAGTTRRVFVKRLTWPVTDYERCCAFFNSLQGKQMI